MNVVLTYHSRTDGVEIPMLTVEQAASRDAPRRIPRLQIRQPLDRTVDVAKILGAPHAMLKERMVDAVQNMAIAARLPISESFAGYARWPANVAIVVGQVVKMDAAARQPTQSPHLPQQSLS